MGVRRKVQSGIAVLQLSGEFYGDTETDELQKEIRRELEAGHLRLVLNLADCAMMNSSALMVMIEAKKAYDAAGGSIKISSADRRMKSLLVTVRLYEWFDHYDTEAQAIEAFSAAAPS